VIKGTEPSELLQKRIAKCRLQPRKILVFRTPVTTKPLLLARTGAVTLPWPFCMALFDATAHELPSFNR
jgi:hypothetical protein